MSNGDSSGYYIHLVSALINQDVGEYSKSTASMVENFPSSSVLLDDPYWLRETSIGRKYIKYSVGVAVMELPAFFLAHIYTKFDHRYASDGWSKPYIISINILKVLYILIGLYFLIPILLNYFNQRITALSIIGIALGTNLFFHVPNLTMAHPFQFFNMCMLIYFTSKFYTNPNYIKAWMIGLFVGLITITRIPEIIALGIPVLWGIYSIKTLKERINFLVGNYKYLIIALVGLILMLSPQISYWHFVSGEFYFNPYAGEGFDFTSPDFFNAFLSYNNGWLVYTPLMLFSLIGLFFLRKRAPSVILPILVFVGLSSWIHFSYYTVNYFPGLGSRVMIESYPLLVFGLAAFFDICKKNQALRIFSLFILVGCIVLNIFQSIQSKKGILLSEQTNRTYYWTIFGRLKIDLNAVKEFDSNEEQPNEDKIELVKNLYFEDFEKVNDDNLSDEFSYSGQFSYFSSTPQPNIKFEDSFQNLNLHPDELIRLSIFSYRKNEDMVTVQWDLERIIIKFYDEKGYEKKSRGFKMARFVGNENNSIFHMGKADVWGAASFFVKVPKKATPEWKMKVTIENKSNKKLYFDDFTIDRFIRK